MAEAKSKKTFYLGTGRRKTATARVFLLWAAANRDPAIFTAPERLDMERHNTHEHLGFGHGIHFCIGARLARMEARAVLDAWLASNIRVVPASDGFDGPTGLVFRKPDRLRVEVGSR